MAVFDYATLVTNQYRKNPNFLQVLNLITESLAENVQLMGFYPGWYDLDRAIGHQLDVIGQWVGVSRFLEVPFNNWFSFNIPGKGFNQGVWRGQFDPPGGLRRLDDVSYKRLIRACIMADHWDGTLWNYHAILQAAMPTTNIIWAEDNFDMTVTIHVTGPKLSPLMEALLTSGRLSEIKPAGVAIAGYDLPP